MGAALQRTRIVLDGHTKWQMVTPDGRRADSWDKERDLLNDPRGRYGGKLVLEDHGLGPADGCAPASRSPARARGAAGSPHSRRPRASSSRCGVGP